MQPARTQQIEVTQSRETVADLARRVEESAQQVELRKKGRIIARVVPEATGGAIVEVPVEEQKASWKRLRKVQQKTGRMMERTGKTEDELMKLILEDD
jgi:antitoxin (DNA-binding transcriptional repressor) of toxin-antitoxin stability system